MVWRVSYCVNSAWIPTVAPGAALLNPIRSPVMCPCHAGCLYTGIIVYAKAPSPVIVPSGKGKCIRRSGANSGQSAVVHSRKGSAPVRPSAFHRNCMNGAWCMSMSTGGAVTHAPGAVRRICQAWLSMPRSSAPARPHPSWVFSSVPCQPPGTPCREKCHPHDLPLLPAWAQNGKGQPSWCAMDACWCVAT